jgi:hypothetical protein
LDEKQPLGKRRSDSHRASRLRRLKRATYLIALAVFLPGVSGCGDDQDQSDIEVQRADLQREGDFWQSLNPESKRRLVAIARDGAWLVRGTTRNPKNRSGWTGYAPLSDDYYVEAIDRFYAEGGRGSVAAAFVRAGTAPPSGK